MKRTIWALFGALFSSAVLAQPAYDRDDWKHWEDFDGDCQNTRQELLIVSSIIPVTFTNARGCTVATGIWLGPYTGQIFTKASDVDIDHIVPLKYASDHGGADWSPLLKKVFANDPDNILVTEDNANQSKGAKGPSEYMPPRQEYRCEYIRRWRFLLSKYELEADADDLRVIRDVGRSCR